MNHSKRSINFAGATAVLGTLALVAGCQGSDSDFTNSGGDSLAEEVSLVFSTYLAESATSMRAMQWWMDEVTERTDGRVEFDPYWSEALVPAADSLAAVADGRADFAYAGSFYHVDRLSLLSVVELPGVTTNPPAQAVALMELYEGNSEFRGQFEAAGVHLLYPALLGENVLGADRPFDSVDALEGMSIRASGMTGAALETVGANGVALAAPEVYESMERGLIQGWSSLPMDLAPSLGLDEVTSHVTGGWYGAYASGPIVMNLETYQGLPDDIRDVIDELSSEMLEVNANVQIETEVEVCEALTDAGVSVTAMPDEVAGEVSDLFVDLEDSWISDRQSEGLDAETFYTEYREALTIAEESVDYSPATLACEDYQTVGRW